MFRLPRGCPLRPARRRRVHRELRRRETPRRLTAYWAGVIDPVANGGRRLTLLATDIDDAHRLAQQRIQAPYVLNGIRLDGAYEAPRGRPWWLWSRTPAGAV